MRKFRIRDVLLMGGRSYPQGLHMTWDDIDFVVELKKGEKICQVEQGVSYSGKGWDPETPYYRVWIQTPL